MVISGHAWTRLVGSTRPAMLVCLAAMATSLARGAEDAPSVHVLRIPDGAVQPQAAIDRQGRVHLVYLAGDPGASDVFYTRLERGTTRFSTAVRVNREPGSAIARGTIRGAHLAIGRRDRVHVAWNGPVNARPANPLGGGPMLYSRLDPENTEFEPQRNLMSRSTALDGGGTIAADAQGHVVVAWHGLPQGAPSGEIHRRLLVTRSDNDGDRFAPEVPALDQPTGACACCGTRALASSDGGIHVLFREVGSGTERAMDWLQSEDHGAHFRSVTLDTWRIATCPMSSASLCEGPDGVVAAWETEGQVFFAKLDSRSRSASKPIHPRGSGGGRKHPAIATNDRGHTIIAWTEGTSFTRGGSLHWRVYDRDGKTTEIQGRIDDGIPLFSLPTVVARPDDGFLIIH